MRTCSKDKRQEAGQLGLFDERAAATMQVTYTAPQRSASLLAATEGRCSGSTGSEVYRLRDLMQMFGYADDTSFRAWRMRVSSDGFPAPLPGCTRPLKWDKGQIDAWRSGGKARLVSSTQEATSPPPVDTIGLAREKLRRKAAMRA
jgi:hypothetical protein